MKKGKLTWREKMMMMRGMERENEGWGEKMRDGERCGERERKGEVER